jgi:hypothetical protein
LRRSSRDVGTSISEVSRKSSKERDLTYLIVVLVVPGAVEIIVVLVVMVEAGWMEIEMLV